MNYKNYFKKNKTKLSQKELLAIQIGGLITEARLKTGVSQVDLAKKIGTKQPSIARAENGELIAGIEFLEKIAKALKIKLVVSFDFSTKSKYKNQNIHLKLSEVSNAEMQVDDMKSPYASIGVKLLEHKIESTNTETIINIINQ